MKTKKIILVSGANSRLGAVVVSELLSRGHIVYKGQRTGGDVKLDVTSNADCSNAIKTIVKKHKRLDVVINIAGLTESGPIIDSEVEHFENLLLVNASGQLRVNIPAAKQMVLQKSGRIINITSLSGRVSLPGFGIYSASKSAAESLGESLHYELADKNVKVVNMATGAIDFGDTSAKPMAHKPVREKIPILKQLLPMTTPSIIAERITSLIESDSNPVKVTIGTDAHLVIALHTYLPAQVFEKIVLLLWNKK